MADDCYSQCAAEVGWYSSDSRAGEISLCSTVFELGALRETPFDQFEKGVQKVCKQYS